MSYCEVDSTCVSDISQYQPVPADSSPSLNETSLQFDRWANDVKPFLECNCEPAESIPLSNEAFTFAGTLRIDCHVKGVLDAGSGTLIVGRRRRLSDSDFANCESSCRSVLSGSEGGGSVEVRTDVAMRIIPPACSRIVARTAVKSPATTDLECRGFR